MEYTVEEYNKKKELAESGNLDAICDLGYLYYYGFGNTAPDIDKGVYYWCTAANLGNAVAQDAMAWCYECGVGVEKNLFTAVDLKMKAANGGYSYAQFDVGNYFYYGYSEVNIEPNAEIAYSWYKKAADQNNGNAQLMVAYCLENGIGTDTNEDKSIEYYEKSASNGIAEAYLNLANIYSRKKMYDKSLELYKMAVDGKNYLAAVNISDYYCMVEESVDEAIKWINIAMQNGFRSMLSSIITKFGGDFMTAASLAKGIYTFCALIAIFVGPIFAWRFFEKIIMVELRERLIFLVMGSGILAFIACVEYPPLTNLNVSYQHGKWNVIGIQLRYSGISKQGMHGKN